MKESSISGPHARDILASVGESDSYIPGADYYVITDDDGEESLVVWGHDHPLAVNPTNTSWLGSNAFRALAAE